MTAPFPSMVERIAATLRYHHISIGRARKIAIGLLRGMREPDEDMLSAARDWSQEKYGKPIGNDAAEGCWRAMLEAAIKGRQ